MNRKRKLICMLIFCIISISFGYIIMFNGYFVKSKDPTVYSSREKEDMRTIKNHLYEEDELYIQLLYPNQLSYPEMRTFDILISNYPFNSKYCKISTNFGNTSVSRINLEKDNRITYSLPDNFDRLTHDIILFEFYDENSQLIGNSKIAVEYEKDKKQCQIFEAKIKSF